MNRREFLKKIGRSGLLSLLGYGVYRSLRSDSEEVRDSRCLGNGVCRACPRRTQCGHPTAISFREAQ
ncbi:MAG: hypothetical protein WCT05_05755 [Lentisphaeria bacterium]